MQALHAAERSLVQPDIHPSATVSFGNTASVAPLFDRYVVVDWSASATPTTGQRLDLE